MHFIFMSESGRLRKRQERKGAGKMSRRKKEDKDGSRAIAKAILEEYQPATVKEMQDALREIFGPMFEALLQGEMEAHLGYKSNDRGAKDSSNRRNGYTDKTVKSSMGDIEIRTPRDRDGSFEPQIVAKRTRDVSGIEDKVLSMYARGLSQRDKARKHQDGQLSPDRSGFVK